MSIRYKNSSDSYGLVAIIMHWLSAFCVMALFALGFWMVDLDYDHAWYRTAPFLHKGIGFFVIMFMLARWLWRCKNVKVVGLSTHSPLEKTLAGYAHKFLYLIVVCMLPTGYLITTSDGQSLNILNWFSLPALITEVKNLEDWAGWVHKYLGFSIIGLAFLHGAAALKHHFVDKDNTLRRMISLPRVKR